MRILKNLETNKHYLVVSMTPAESDSNMSDMILADLQNGEMIFASNCRISDGMYIRWDSDEIHSQENKK